MPIVNPVIVIPGITATYLRDEYPLPPETIWAVLGRDKDYGRAALHPDDTRWEAKEPARVVPGQLYEIAYEELIEELRFNLREREDRPVPVFPFGYDWRQPLDSIELWLGDFIDEVIERTKLLRHYDRGGYAENPRVNLVGHSMGGLVIAGYLQRVGKDARVEKVATLATPYQGSFEPVIKVTTGTANLGTSPPSSREREAARVTPALYHLIPSFKPGVEIHKDLPQSLFSPAVWQPSILKTIAQYIRSHGLNPQNDREQAAALFGALLAASEKHRKRIDGFKLADANMVPADWLCVVGVDSETRVRLEIVIRNGKPAFSFRSADRQNEWEDGDAQLRRSTGDGTVPFEGAVPKFLGLENLVCVSPDDFGYWEVQDRALVKVAGFHGILPNMNMLHRLIVRHFTGRLDRHRNTWGRPAPGVEDWQPPIPNLEPK